MLKRRCIILLLASSQTTLYCAAAGSGKAMPTKGKLHLLMTTPLYFGSGKNTQEFIDPLVLEDTLQAQDVLVESAQTTCW